MTARPMTRMVEDSFQRLNAIKVEIQRHGQLFAFTPFKTSSGGSCEAVVEFCNVASALSAVAAYSGSPVFEVDREPMPTSLCFEFI